MITINANNERVLTLGYRGEKNVRKVVFDISDLKATYGDGEASLTNLRVGEYVPYNVTNCKVSDDGNSLEWLINDTDTGKAGKYGSCQLTYTVDNAVAMTKTWQTEVYKSLTPTGKAPEPYYSWLTDVKETAKSIEDKVTETEDFIAGIGDAIDGIPEQIEHINSSVISAEKSALLAQEVAEEIKNTVVGANQITPTAEGSSILLSDSADAPIVEAKIYGKTTQPTNLLSNIAVTTTVSCGVEITVTGSRTITLRGTATASQDVYLSGCPSSLKNGVSYSLFAPSMLVIENQMNPAIDYIVGGGSGVFVVPNMILAMLLKLEEGVTYDESFTPVLLKSGESLEITHVQNPTITVQNEDASKTQAISFMGYTLRGVKDSNGNWFARDEIVCDGKTVKLIQKISGAIIEDGTKTYLSYANGCVRETNTNFKRVKDTSNTLLFVSDSADSGIQFANAATASNSKIEFKYNAVGAANYDEFIAILTRKNANGTPFTWYAPLETPIETNITDTEAGQALLALHTHYPTTTVISDTDVSITYVADTKNYIDNKFNTLAAAIVAQ